MNARASSAVLYIFQLAAISFVFLGMVGYESLEFLKSDGLRLAREFFRRMCIDVINGFMKEDEANFMDMQTVPKSLHCGVYGNHCCIRHRIAVSARGNCWERECVQVHAFGHCQRCCVGAG